MVKLSRSWATFACRIWKTARAAGWRAINLKRFFLPIIATAYLVFVGSYLFVWAADPYSLRGFNNIGALSDRPYKDEVVIRLVSIAARDGSDLAVVGGSTSLGFTSEYLREAFPSINKPINLAFSAPRVDELITILEKLESSQTLKNLIIAIDWTWLRPNLLGKRREIKFHSPPAWNNPVPEFHTETVLTAARLLRTRSIDQSSWFRGGADQPAWLPDIKPVSENIDYMKKLRAAANDSRSIVTAYRPVSCMSLPGLTDRLTPLVKRLAARGVIIDLYFPPYSLAVFSEWTFNPPPGGALDIGGSVFSSLMTLRRCTLELLGHYKNVRISAFETNFSITANLQNYTDSAHLRRVETYRDLLLQMANGRSMLTKEKWPEFEAELKKAVDNFNPYPSTSE
jgi:hypothetical protein